MELHHPTVLKTGTYFVAGPKSIHRCRRYPTKFNSGRDIPLIHGLLIAGGPLLVFLVYPWAKKTILESHKPGPMPEKPVNGDEYKKERKRIFYDIYLFYINHYHKTLLYTAGGSFLVSFSAIQIVLKQPDGTIASESSPFS